jgi:hypothetical protein
MLFSYLIMQQYIPEGNIWSWETANKLQLLHGEKTSN